MPPTGDLTSNPGMCPDWESNRQPFGWQSSAQSTEPHQPELGNFSYHLKCMLSDCTFLFLCSFCVYKGHHCFTTYIKSYKYYFQNNLHCLLSKISIFCLQVIVQCIPKVQIMCTHALRYINILRILLLYFYKHEYFHY